MVARELAPVNSARDIEYLQRVLRLNPLDSAPEIMAARQLHREASDEAPLFFESPEERHEGLANHLEFLRKSFWSRSEAEIRRQLDELPLTEFPDLKLAATILRSIAPRLPAFARLKEHPDCFPEFLELFQNLVLASPKQAVALRRRLLSAARVGEAFPIRRSSQEFRRIAHTIEVEFPELASLQTCLLAQIRSPRRRLSFVSGLENPLGPVAALVVLALVAWWMHWILEV